MPRGSRWAGTPTYGFEGDVVLPDGTRHTLLWNVTRLLDVDGAPEGILAIGQDITARTAAERRFERSADGLLLMRTPSGVLECNQAALDMLGITSAQELRDRHLAEFSPPLQPDGVPSVEQSRRMDALAEETGFHRFEWMHRDASGAPLPVEVSLSHLGRERGEALFLVTWHDLRPRKKAEAQREALEARLRHAERLEVVGQFAGGIAHDFNNLLTVIVGNLEFVRADVAAALPEAPGIQAELDQIGHASARARSCSRSSRSAASSRWSRGTWSSVSSCATWRSSFAASSARRSCSTSRACTRTWRWSPMRGASSKCC